MFRAIYVSLYHRWRHCPLSVKLLLPIIGLMLISLLVSALAFVWGTRLTQDQLISQKVNSNTERVRAALLARVEDVNNAAVLLANDPSVLGAAQQDTQASLSILNNRAVVVRERLDLDLIQIYNQHGQARTNLVLSSLYRESLLIGQTKTGVALALVGEGRLLLLGQANMPDKQGIVIAGLDLDEELRRIVSRYSLSTDLGLSVYGFGVSTRDQLAFNAPNGWNGQRYYQRVPLTLGDTPVELVLAQSNADIAQVATTGLGVMVGSGLLTTLLLIGLSVFITRSITQPIHRLAAAAQTVARGDLKQQIEIVCLSGEDEIGQLSAAFDYMVTQLRNLRKTLEDKVQARTRELTDAYARLQELDRVKDQFVQNVSHELRTPVGIILAYAELLDNGELGKLQPQQQDSVSIIARRACLLKKLVDDLTILMEAEEGLSKHEIIDMAELVAALSADFQIMAHKAMLSLSAEIAPDLPYIKGDPAHLRRACDNLIGNALKFTPAGGAIKVRLWPDNGNVVVEVADTGIGIPLEQQERVFDRFYQVDGSMSRRYGGVGLGLALVKEIVQDHNGHISLESEPGRGSVFRIALPADHGDRPKRDGL